MREERTLLLGNKRILLKKITYKEWRKINPKTNEYIGYFSPDHSRGSYYKFLRRGNLPKILEQIKLYCSQDFTFETESFIKKISFIPCYFYDNLLSFKDEEIPKDILIWRKNLKAILEKKFLPVLPFPVNQLKHILIDQKRSLQGKGIAFLNYWTLEVVSGRAKVGLCSSFDCDRIFSQSRKDQEYCSEYCRAKSLQLKNRRKTLNKA